MKAEAILVISQKSRAVGVGGVPLETKRSALPESFQSREKNGESRNSDSEVILTSGMFSRRVYQVDGL